MHCGVIDRRKHRFKSSHRSRDPTAVIPSPNESLLFVAVIEVAACHSPSSTSELDVVPKCAAMITDLFVQGIDSVEDQYLLHCPDTIQFGSHTRRVMGE